MKKLEPAEIRRLAVIALWWLCVGIVLSNLLSVLLQPAQPVLPEPVPVLLLSEPVLLPERHLYFLLRLHHIHCRLL